MPSKAEQLAVSAVRGAMIGVILACLLYGDRLQAGYEALRQRLRRPLSRVEQEVSEILDKPQE